MNDKEKERIERCTVRIECINKSNNKDSEFGTGFLVEKNIVVTASHVINKYYEDPLNYFMHVTPIKAKQDKDIKVKCVIENKKNRFIAILELEENVKEVNPLKFALDYRIKRNDMYFSFGYPKLKIQGHALENKIVTNINEIQSKRANWELKIVGEKLDDFSGFSGAPVVIDDRLIGIIQTQAEAGGKALSIAMSSIDIMREYISDEYCIENKKEFFQGFNDTLGLLNSSEKYYSSLKEENGRFHYLNIVDMIIPNGKFVETNIKLNEKYNMPLKESMNILWKKSCWHAVIVGEGGMGKTVSLLRLWKEYLGASGTQYPIPLFIELSEYNTAQEEEKANFIIKQIGCYYLNKMYLTHEEEEALWDIIKTPITIKETKIPSVILFLDGFNEISVEKSELLVELRKIIKLAHGIQIIITSRTDMRQMIGLQSFNRIDLQKLTVQQIEKFLNISINLGYRGKLYELIKNPMMISLYSATSKTVEQYSEDPRFDLKREIETSGELLWNFVESQIIKKYEDNCFKSNSIYYTFLLKFIIPYIGYKMELGGEFSITSSELKIIIDDIYEKYNSDIFFDAFDSFIGFENTLGMEMLSGVDKRERFFKTKNTICEELAILVEENGRYRFIHQNFRDYFAAVHIINQIKIGNFDRKIPEEIKENIISDSVRRFIGDIEGEHLRKPQLSEDGWTLNKDNKSVLYTMIEQCKGVFDGSIGFAVWNIVEIWKCSRGELTGLNLSNLDLSRIGLNNIICTRWYKDKSLTTDFNKSKISNKNILSQGHTAPINNISYSRDGKKILTDSSDGTIKEWDVLTGECLKVYDGMTRIVFSAEYSNCGTKILSSSIDGISEWDIESGKCTKYFDDSGWKGNATYSKDDKKIIVHNYSGYIKEWDIDKETYIKKYKVDCKYGEVKYSLNNESVFILSPIEGVFEEICMHTGEVLRVLNKHFEGIETITYSFDERKVLTACKDGTIMEWDMETLEYIRTYGNSVMNAYRVVYSRDGKKILSAHRDGHIMEWSTETGECIGIYTVRYSSFDKFLLKYSKDAKKMLVALMESATFMEIDIYSGELIRRYEGNINGVNDAIYNAEGNIIITVSQDCIIREWDVEKGICIKSYLGHFSEVSSVTYSNDGSKILSASDDKTIREWSTESGRCLKVYEGNLECVNYATYSPDNMKILSACSDGVVKEWFTDTQEFLEIYKCKQEEWITKVKYNRDGKKALISFGNGLIIEVSMDTKQTIRAYMEHSEVVYDVIYYNRENKILSASYDNKIKEWSTSTGECLRTYIGHNGSVNSIELSYDEEKILSASADHTIKEWDTKTGQCIQTYEGHSGNIQRAVYSKDRKKILSASSDGTAREWSVETGECIRTYYNHSGLIIQNCSFRDLHVESDLSKEDIDIFKHYGAIVDL